ncbi:MAG TPA: arginine--tRNA ligase [Candidatus Altiarchaeales archaeon]|nr:arginine--tRNA ligase [Candidatus Altiarchaeales archaeon]
MIPVKAEAAKKLSKALGFEVTAEDLKDSPNADFGFPAFKPAKDAGRKPQEFALEIASKIKPSGLIKSVEASKGYVNFHTDSGMLAKSLLEEMARLDGSFGKPPEAPAGKIILEHTSVNPSGPIHVGRLRNTLIGDSLRRILKFYGYKVETHYYVNDIGKQIAIIAKGLEQDVEQDPGVCAEYSQFGHKKDFQIFFTYVTANRMYEEDEEFKKSVDALILKAESGDAKALDTITGAAKKALAGQLETFAKLEVEFDFFDFESTDLKEGRVFQVMRRVRNSDYVREGKIGVGVDLSEFGIEKRGGFTVLERPNGTSVYLARDTAYHLEKLKLGDRIINVLGEDHKLQAQELAMILKHVFNVEKPVEVVHFSFVNFEGEKFSTRRGEIASVDMLLDEAQEKAKDEILERDIGDVHDASTIGVGAVKFSILKTTPLKPITFKWSDALSFEGESAPYIQYAHARSARILEKSGVNPESIKVSECDPNLENDEEKELVKKLMLFPQAVEESVKHLRPDIICQYLLELTGVYGRFYMKCPVIDSGEKARNRRILLVFHTKNVLAKGLELLGIGAPQRM